MLALMRVWRKDCCISNCTHYSCVKSDVITTFQLSLLEITQDLKKKCLGIKQTVCWICWLWLKVSLTGLRVIQRINEAHFWLCLGISWSYGPWISCPVSGPFILSAAPLSTSWPPKDE